MNQASHLPLKKWTEVTTTKAFVGVSAHWIRNAWEHTFAVLNCEEFSGKHTGENMAAKFESVLNEWNIPKESVHVVIRDNAANTVKAFECAALSSFGCSLHTLQLAINDRIFNQKSVSDALAVCRRLVGHFIRETLRCLR